MELDLFNCLHSYVPSCQRHLKNECNIFLHCQRTDFLEHSTSHDCQPKIDWTSFAVNGPVLLSFGSFKVVLGVMATHLCYYSVLQSLFPGSG